jgi:hypothetical protein
MREYGTGAKKPLREGAFFYFFPLASIFSNKLLMAFSKSGVSYQIFPLSGIDYFYIGDHMQIAVRKI